MRNPRVGAYMVCCLFGLVGGPGPACAEDQAGGVESLNGLKGKVQLAAGSNITITKTGKKTLTIGGGLTLPYAASGTSLEATLKISNNGIGGASLKGIATGTQGTGVYGRDESLTNGWGVYGYSYAGTGVYGFSATGTAVTGYTSSGVAGSFTGNVNVTGILTKGGGAFKIDHPLDPQNKYLYHSFVESPDMMNIYNGNAVLDANGEALVELPEWFDTLNRDFRYQLTCIGGFAPVYISEEISANRFRVAGGRPGLRVSWQVTGIRQDPYANAHRIPVEEVKPADEGGHYLHPDAYGEPGPGGIEMAPTQEVSRK